MSKDALVTAFTTGNLFVVLTVLTDNCKMIFDKYNLKREKTDTYIDVLIPISFNFPNVGKLIMLLFILFAVWFSGSTLNLGQYGTFIFSGLLMGHGGIARRLVPQFVHGPQVVEELPLGRPVHARR